LNDEAVLENSKSFCEDCKTGNRTRNLPEPR